GGWGVGSWWWGDRVGGVLIAGCCLTCSMALPLLFEFMSALAAEPGHGQRSDAARRGDARGDQRQSRHAYGTHRSPLDGDIVRIGNHSLEFDAERRTADGAMRSEGWRRAACRRIDAEIWFGRLLISRGTLSVADPGLSDRWSRKANVNRLSAEGARITTGKLGERRRGGADQLVVGVCMDGCLHPFQPLAGLRIERIDEKGWNSCRQQRL